LPPFGDLRLHGFLQLFEGSNLDLTHAFARDAVLLRQILERGRIVLQPSLDQDVTFAFVQGLQGA
jgi:hypothetical protein